MNRYVIFCLIFVLASCRKNDDNDLRIDQVTRFYITDSHNKDLLNPQDSTVYTSVKMFDLNGIRDLVPITSFSVEKDDDDKHYLDYSAGATRVLTDSVSTNEKYYESSFILSLGTKRGTEIIYDDDTVTLSYRWTPTLFQLQDVYYNRKKVFAKTAGAPNHIHIVK